MQDVNHATFLSPRSSIHRLSLLSSKGLSQRSSAPRGHCHVAPAIRGNLLSVLIMRQHSLTTCPICAHLNNKRRKPHTCLQSGDIHSKWCLVTPRAVSAIKCAKESLPCGSRHQGQPSFCSHPATALLTTDGSCAGTSKKIKVQGSTCTDCQANTPYMTSTVVKPVRLGRSIACCHCTPLQSDKE